MAWRCGACPRSPNIKSASVVPLCLVPRSSSLTAFFYLPVAWPAGPRFSRRGWMHLVCVCDPRSALGCLSRASQRRCMRSRPSAILCTSTGRISAAGCPRLPAFPFCCSCCAAARPSLAQASPPRLSASARVAPVRPVSESLPLLSCALAGVGRLGVCPRPVPCCRQRLCLWPSAWLWPSRAS
jgi:hypothetical protein